MECTETLSGLHVYGLRRLGRDRCVCGQRADVATLEALRQQALEMEAAEMRDRYRLGIVS